MMEQTLKDQLKEAHKASHALNRVSEEQIDRLLMNLADAVEKHMETILQANAADLSRMDPADPKYDRLRLSQERIQGMAADIRKVADLASPCDVVLKEWTQPNGMHIRKVSVPFGVIGVIYEARPNVTLDVFSLCLKSRNACVLKGGSDADMSNNALRDVIRTVLKEENFPEACVTLLPPGHEQTQEMLRAVGDIDLIIPRGSRNLIQYVRSHALVPVIETGAGICHCYFHSSGSLEKGKAIVCNAKTRRVSVCNALDCLLIDRSRLADLPELVSPLAACQVEIYADDEAYGVLKGRYERLEHANEESWGREYLDYKMSVRVVSGLEEALEHIACYSSHHSESVVAEDPEVCRIFSREVDAACVYTNLPTSFTDGGQFGFGAEIGISTQKLHARGPMALPELTTYKYLISGDGQIRD